MSPEEEARVMVAGASRLPGAKVIPDCLYVGFPNPSPPGAGSVMVTEFSTDGSGNPLSASATPLPVRLDLDAHSPDGFNWGYGGSGPAQLALALCAHATGNDEMAISVHQKFKRTLLGRLPGDEQWAITANLVRVLVEVCLRG